MKSNLKDRQTIHPSAEKIVAKSQKTPYASPVMQVYGSVRKLTQGGASVGVDGGGRQAASDRSIKENIVRIDVHPLGIGLYLFDYKPEFREQWGSGRQFGVMADEVEPIMPQAVSNHPDGYKVVNYALLGISVTVH